jgi:ABC-type multidrug transport system fused ATPase/permease subunit
MRDPRAVTVTPGDMDRKIAMLRWALGLLPPHPDTDDGKLRVLISILVALVIIVIIANVFRYVGEVLISDAILRAMIGLRAQLYERTLHLPMSYFSGQPSADLVTRFVQDVQEIQRGMLTVFGKFVREPLRAIFIFVAALLIDWTVTLSMVVIAPAAIVVFLLVGRAVKNANRKLLQAYGTMIGALTASLQNLRVVKAYTAEDQERERLRQVDLGMFRQQLTLAKLRAFVTPTMETLGVLVGSLLTVWLASRVLSHELSVSTFATLGVALSMLFDPLRKLSDVWVRVQRSTAGAERIFQVIDQPVESDLSEANVALAPLAQGIEYDNVTFTYPAAESPALEGIRLTIAKGETLAVVGPNGSGKTTLVNMLPRFFDPDEGTILYDGLDIRKATLRSLRDQISLVSQEAVVFAGTPLENIVYGTAHPDEARAMEAARRAYADEFIRNIPGGYRAALGERGTTLSGGQRQRLAIARAIFRDAPILIFDEATSQIDTESEQKIQTVLREFSQDRTTLIIAHRMSTIQFANRIIVMDAGRIIDSGAHQDLFERCVLYRTLCETQFVTEGG